MPLTLRTAARLLSDHGLLREVIHDDRWMMQVPDDPADDVPFSAITYDTRTVGGGSLLVCKGRFRPEYLDGLDRRGLAAYVADTDYSAVVDAPGLIVDDPRKALSLLSAEFYGRPQDELTVIGITGTKGKTTTAYLTQAILNAHSGGRCALFSSVDNCLDGHTYEESDLTTPESLDAFRMMRQAADNGMRYLVMEVSSQAYKVHRVHGLTFDIGAFLNISPDHISPIEHPTFEDYLHCKRQLITNSKTLVVNAEDTDTEPYEDICNDMMRHVTDPDVDARIVVDRVTALTEAIRDARGNPERRDMVLVIGKGHERWIKDRNRHMPYEGDDKVVARLLSEPLE